MNDHDVDPVQAAKQYYNSEDADAFYTQVWGGEDLHLGIYESEDESIFDASRRAVERMASFSSLLDESARVLDIGAGYGGTARFLARTHGCHVTALNLSEVENERDRRMNREQGLDHLVTVVDGAFEELPFDDGSFDIVWSQDSLLHSSDREGVLAQVERVLRPGGEFIFSDPMQADDCPDGVLAPILERIHLETLASPRFYQQAAARVGLQVVQVEDQTPNLIRHYSRVLQETSRNEEALEKTISREYLSRMKAGLKHWIDGGENGYLAWCLFMFRKP